MEPIKQFGEPGFYFVESREHTTNPCVEIGMYPQIDGKSGWQGCNLTEINGGKCTSKEEFFKACVIIFYCTRKTAFDEPMDGVIYVSQHL